VNRAERIQYYAGRVLNRLERHGFPLRSRSLMFFQRAVGAECRGVTSYARGGVTGPVSEDQFRGLRWAANPNVVREVLERRGRGRRWAIAARRGNEMDGFCWLESHAANMFFFDLEYPIPIGTHYMSQVWVSPEIRGQGIGRALILAAESFAADSSATKVFAGCVPQNWAMRHLFAQLGWSYQQRVDYLRIGPAMGFRFSAESGSNTYAGSISAAARLLTASTARDDRSESRQPSMDSRADTAK
jgi:GNAT superfamily N-acetyltransferase